MEHINLGKTGLKVSRICLGCMSYAVNAAAWRLDEPQSRPFIQRALELGINFFDAANPPDRRNHLIGLCMNIRTWTPRKLVTTLRLVLRHWTASPVRTQDEARTGGMGSGEVCRDRVLRPHWYW